VKRTIPRVVSFALALAISGSMCIGCSTKSNTSISSSAASSTPVKLTYWFPTDSNIVGAGITDMNDLLYIKEAEKATGVNIKFITPALGQEDTQFNLMVASGDLPDLIRYNFATYNGGPEKAIADGIIINHSSLFNKYATNFNKFLKAFPTVEKLYKTDSGKVYNMPAFMVSTPSGKTDTGWENSQLYSEATIGPALRADWLKAVGLSAPTSISEWYNVLKAFKTKENATAPLTFQLSLFTGSSCFISAYNIAYGFYEDGNKKVLYGPEQPAYKEFLTTFAQWYKEGLLDSDFSTNDSKAVDAKVLSGKSGAWLGFSGGGVGNYIQSGKKINANFDVIGSAYPSQTSGSVAEMGNKNSPYLASNSTSITTANKHQVESVKFLDYFYSDEGYMVGNWGMKGTSYNLVDGTPVFSGAIAKDPTGLTPTVALMKYVGWGKLSAAEDFNTRLALYATYGTTRITEAKNLWGETKMNSALPPVTIASDKSNAYAKVMSTINTYVDEEFAKFVMGTESLNNFDAYVAQLKKMGIDSAVMIQQQALDRYYKR
jgi:putative aldouronate transport system substrate-binding protein